MHDEGFSEEQDREPCLNASTPQDAAQAGLRITKATDLRDFEDWANDSGFCQRFLIDRPLAWCTAIQRYWRERCTRRQLASELGSDLETTKNLLRRIRKAARDCRSGITRLPRDEEGVRYDGRPHSGINAQDILAIADGDAEAMAHCEEYGRLNTIERLMMFAPAITGELVKVFGHSDAMGVTQNEAITSGLVAKAEKLKARVVEPDPFLDRPVTALFADECTRMKIPETDENGVTRWKVRLIGRAEAEPIERGRPRTSRTQTTTKIPTARNTGILFMSDETKKKYKLSRNGTVRFIKDSELVKQDLAAIANVPAARLSDYLHDKPVSEEYAGRIENAVANIIYVWTTFAPIKIALDDAAAFWKAVELADKTHAAQSAWDGYQAGHRMKQEHNEGAAAAD